MGDGYRQAGVGPQRHRGLPSPWLTFIVTLDDPLVIERALAGGATVVRELADTDYGSRDFAVLDPEGNHWSFGTYRGHPRG